ncbi:MAG TPA: DUF6069 family protein [Acidimicrobiia bacterium]|jgi:hypothetical protein|nr:DUF6069 family protein [Acidimicrobiia bacterium]
MTGGGPSRAFNRSPLLDVDLLRYWASVLFTGLIASFAALILVRFAGDVFSNQLLVSDQGGSSELVPLADGRVFWTAMIATFTAGATLNIMLYVLPSPMTFFNILSFLVLAFSMLWPISLDVGPEETAWLIAVHAVVGLVIIGLLNAIVGFVTRPHVDPPPPPPV